MVLNTTKSKSTKSKKKDMVNTELNELPDFSKITLPDRTIIDLSKIDLPRLEPIDFAKIRVPRFDQTSIPMCKKCGKSLEPNKFQDNMCDECHKNSESEN
ncbi:MAG: hypothetical protein ACREAK_11600 [Nitrosarchaeum sp.]